jgi:hypothetical protein
MDILIEGKEVKACIYGIYVHLYPQNQYHGLDYTVGFWRAVDMQACQFHGQGQPVALGAGVG